MLNRKFSLDQSIQEILYGIERWFNEGCGSINPV